MSAPELKPCPFCGGEAVYYIDHTTECCDSVYCQTCGAAVSDFDLEGPQGSCVELWNRRAPDPALIAEAVAREREEIATMIETHIYSTNNGERMLSKARIGVSDQHHATIAAAIRTRGQ
jgi:Lar family restriction alleviation protein